MSAAVALGRVTWPGTQFVSRHRGDQSISFQLRALYTLSTSFGFHVLLTPRGNSTTGGLFAPVPVPSLVEEEGPRGCLHHFQSLVSCLAILEVRDTLLGFT